MTSGFTKTLNCCQTRLELVQVVAEEPDSAQPLAGPVVAAPWRIDSRKPPCRQVVLVLRTVGPSGRAIRSLARLFSPSHSSIVSAA